MNWLNLRLFICLKYKEDRWKSVEELFTTVKLLLCFRFKKLKLCRKRGCMKSACFYLKIGKENQFDFFIAAGLNTSRGQSPVWVVSFLRRPSYWGNFSLSLLVFPCFNVSAWTTFSKPSGDNSFQSKRKETVPEGNALRATREGCTLVWAGARAKGIHSTIHFRILNEIQNNKPKSRPRLSVFSYFFEDNRKKTNVLFQQISIANCFLKAHFWSNRLVRT